ncbi:MAG: SRPBCC family protein [Caldilineaceae bacterium]|nr:SRPBCC family protein [Caldilineaceae bacterium]
MLPLLYAFLALALVVILYLTVIRPRQLTWGATQKEAVGALPGDDIVAGPHFVATRAITIQAPPAEVWQWIVQIGSRRAGWYSLDFIDNGNVPSSRDILPQFQQLSVGHYVPFTPDQKNGMWVKAYAEPDYILWWDQKETATWGWYLSATGEDATRLVTRLRTRYDFSFPWVLYYVLYDFGDIIMMSNCMKGIKARAEARWARAHLDSNAPQIQAA